MADPFEYHEDIHSNPESWYVVVPADGADLPTKPKALLFKAAGNVVLTGKDSVDITLAVVANQQLNLRPKRIKATGTTVAAGNIIALV